MTMMTMGSGTPRKQGVGIGAALAITIALGMLPGVPGTPKAWGNEGRSPATELTEVDAAARRHYEAGLALAYRGNYERAIAEFDRAIRLEPTFSAAFQDRGSSHLALRNSVAAMADYNRAIELSPNDSNAYYNRGNLHLQLEQYFRAIADYDRAISLNGSDAAAWQNRALGYAVVGNLEAAVNGFQQAARLFQLQDNPEGYAQVLQILEHFQPDLENQIPPETNPATSPSASPNPPSTP